MKVQSLRVRLILAYAGLIVLGFSGLAFIAGQQISQAARDDYELQLANEVILVAQGIARSAREYQGDIITEDDLKAGRKKIDDVTKQYTDEVDSVIKSKADEIMLD